jgi:hypothetical protein
VLYFGLVDSLQPSNLKEVTSIRTPEKCYQPPTRKQLFSEPASWLSSHQRGRSILAWIRLDQYLYRSMIGRSLFQAGLIAGEVLHGLVELQNRGFVIPPANPAGQPQLTNFPCRNKLLGLCKLRQSE